MLSRIIARLLIALITVLLTFLSLFVIDPLKIPESIEFIYSGQNNSRIAKYVCQNEITISKIISAVHKTIGYKRPYITHWSRNEIDYEIHYITDTDFFTTEYRILINTNPKSQSGESQSRIDVRSRSKLFNILDKKYTLGLNEMQIMHFLSVLDNLALSDCKIIHD